MAALNRNKMLQHIRARDPKEIQTILRMIKLDTEVVSIYGLGEFHYCWFYSSQKIEQAVKLAAKMKGTKTNGRRKRS